MKNHIKILTILRSLVPFKMLPGTVKGAVCVKFVE